MSRTRRTSAFRSASRNAAAVNPYTPIVTVRSIAPSLPRGLLRDDVELLDRGLFEQFARLLTERLRNAAGQVRLAAVVIWKRVEDRERRGAEAHGEPPDGLRLAFDDRQSLHQELLDVVVAARLCFECDPESLGNAGHDVFLRLFETGTREVLPSARS